MGYLTQQSQCDFDRPEGAIRELHIQDLMRDAGVSRRDAIDALNKSSADYEFALYICRRSRAARERQWETTLEATLPTADTGAPPDVDQRTHIVAILGVDEDDEELKDQASPSVGDGWMVSDFYLWMHVLDGMGKSQKWITCLPPASLVEKYSDEDAFVHGDPFEDRAVVLDEETLPFAQSKVTIGPHGAELRQFFLDEVRETMTQAAANKDLVLILLFSHGDWDSRGLSIGSQAVDEILSQKLPYGVLSPFPEVPVSLFMTSCYSGHWVKTPKFNPANLVVLAAAGHDEEPSGFVWSLPKRHTGGIFTAAALEELLEEPASLPLNRESDESRVYRELTLDLLSTSRRLCLPVNAFHYGSTPVFSDDKFQHDKFWRRTGYQLHQYKENYAKLRKIPASDPHPMLDRKASDAMEVGGVDRRVVEWERRHPDVVDLHYPEVTGGYGCTRRGFTSRSSLLYLAVLYVASRPAQSIDRFYRHHIAQIGRLKNRELPKELQEKLRRTIQYRLAMNERVNQYAHVLNLHRLPLIEKWIPESPYFGHEKDIIGLVHDAKLFRRPVSDRLKVDDFGGAYRKPEIYLSRALAEAGYNRQEASVELFKLQSKIKEGYFMDCLAKELLKTDQFQDTIRRTKSMLSSIKGVGREDLNN